MKRFALAAALAMGAALAVPAAAVAGTAPAHAARCVAHYDWSTGTNFPSVERYVQADWETQCSPAIEMQVRITCATAIGQQVYHVDSGDVVALELNDKAHCASGDRGLVAAIHFFSGGHWGAWKTLCAPCSFRKAGG